MIVGVPAVIPMGVGPVGGGVVVEFPALFLWLAA